ncbi:hypothetical protein [Wenyingzhuangia aestuarii]|uniref:hypothetical protein n=1 Tax=Wenyingzhuangia aestuarii TaxID=1647582 RepID=UPI00143A7EF3|nr:hypothetical protein [Wenyingzhuangia aestuarii]NJB81649.1 hypothetical protein [Wenyingzhuangia aestuarii]
MKNIKKIIQIISIVAFLVGCNNDEVNSLAKFNDATWSTSEYNYANTTSDINFGINKGDYISFIDLSQNAISHEWIIEKEDKFLNPNFKTSDKNLIPFINNDLGTVSTSKPAHILFLKPGINEVKMVNTFDSPVTFNGKVKIESVKKGDVYELKNIWKVDVYDSLKPAVKISKEDDLGVKTELYNSAKELIPADGVINIEAGESLIYEDITTIGRPNANSWKSPGSNQKTASGTKNVVFDYLKLGEFEAGSLSVSRDGDDKTVPKAESQVLDIPLKIIVNKSSKPFNIIEESVVRLESNKISFDVSGELKAFTDQEANFNVHVTNTAASFDSDITVTKAQVSSTNKATIELTLASDIYNTDDIKVSYIVGATTIVSADERDLLAFTDQTVRFTDELLDSDYYGFELGGSEWFIQHPDQWSYSSSFANTGTNSLKFSEADVSSMDNKIKVQGTSATELKIVAGTYNFSINVWIDVDSDLNTLLTNFQGTTFKSVKWDLTGVKKGEWVKLNQEVTLADYDNTNNDKLVFQINKVDVISTSATMYVDDISMVPVEQR